MRIVVIGILTLFGSTGWAQTKDTLKLATDTLKVTATIDFLYQRLLDEVENWEAPEDEENLEQLEALLEAYEDYKTNPININSDDVLHLEEMGLLSSFQVESLKQYRKNYGDLLLVEELMIIEHFDPRTVAVISPIVCFGKSEWVQEQEKITIGKAVTRGKHQLTLNYARKSDADTSYLGSPDKIQLKYSYRYGTKFRMGFAMEKDAGEPFLYGRLCDTLRELASSYRKPGFDFYGAFLYLTDIGLKGDEGRGLRIKDLALGDYQLSFGQGLTLWSGMSVGKGAGGSSLMKRGAGVRPKASAGEGKFFRGSAITLAFRDFQATAFYSRRWIDATVVESDTLEDSLDDPELVSAMQETGYHRTLGELAKRHTLRQQVFGGHLAYTGPQLEIGCTAYHVRLDKTLQLKPSHFNQYYFQGDRLTVAGLDFRWQLSKAVFYGELSISDNKAFAGLAGVTFKPAGYIDFTLLYRNYGQRYQNLLLGAMKESSRGQAEEGYYFSVQCAPAPRWNILAYADFFRFKWLTSQAYSPSWGQEYSLKVLRQINENTTMQLRFKSKTKMKNSTDDHSYSYYPIFYTKRSVQFQFNYTLFGNWVFSNKASYSHYFNDDSMDSRGYLLCQDVAYKPSEKPYSLTFRYALFDSDDYNSRISMYENDVLGAFSIPSLFGRGSRVYFLGKVKVFDALTFYARIGCSLLSDETKYDFKTEMVWKF